MTKECGQLDKLKQKLRQRNRLIDKERKSQMHSFPRKMRVIIIRLFFKLMACN